MIIKTETRSYMVKWVACGWSYAVPFVYVKRTGWFSFFSKWKKVYEGDSKSAITAEKMHRSEVEEWFIRTVKQYEEWEKSWSE